LARLLLDIDGRFVPLVFIFLTDSDIFYFFSSFLILGGCGTEELLLLLIGNGGTFF